MWSLLGAIPLAAFILVGAIFGNRSLEPIMWFLGIVTSGILIAWILIRYCVAIPVAVVESVAAGEALGRSVDLTKGHSGRVFFLGILVPTLTSVVPLILPSLLFQLLVQTLVGPLGLITIGLLYFDLRVRKGGFNRQQMSDEID